MEKPPRSALASVTSSDVRKGASRRISRARRQVCIIVGRPKEVERAPTQKPTDDVDAPTADRSPGNWSKESKRGERRGRKGRRERRGRGGKDRTGRGGGWIDQPVRGFLGPQREKTKMK